MSAQGEAKGGRKSISREDIARIKRHAIQIVAQLPEDTAEAEMVLEQARRLVREFLAQPHLREVS